MKVLNILLQQVILSRLDYFDDPKFWIDFNGSCLKPDRLAFSTKKIINLYIIFEIKSWPFYVDNEFTFRNSLFEDVNLIKKVDPDKYSYSGYGISIDVSGTFSL